MLVQNNNKLTRVRKIELWMTAHLFDYVVKIVLFLLGMSVMYGAMLTMTICFYQTNVFWHALGWLILLLVGSFIYYVIRPIPEK